MNLWVKCSNAPACAVEEEDVEVIKASGDDDNNIRTKGDPMGIEEAKNEIEIDFVNPLMELRDDEGDYGDLRTKNGRVAAEDERYIALGDPIIIDEVDDVIEVEHIINPWVEFRYDQMNGAAEEERQVAVDDLVIEATESPLTADFSAVREEGESQTAGDGVGSMDGDSGNNKEEDGYDLSDLRTNSWAVESWAAEKRQVVVDVVGSEMKVIGHKKKRRGIKLVKNLQVSKGGKEMEVMTKMSSVGEKGRVLAATSSIDSIPLSITILPVTASEDQDCGEVPPPAAIDAVHTRSSLTNITDDGQSQTQGGEVQNIDEPVAGYDISAGKSVKEFVEVTPPLQPVKEEKSHKADVEVVEMVHESNVEEESITEDEAIANKEVTAAANECADVAVVKEEEEKVVKEELVEDDTEANIIDENVTATDAKSIQDDELEQAGVLATLSKGKKKGGGSIKRRVLGIRASLFSSKKAKNNDAAAKTVKDVGAKSSGRNATKYWRAIGNGATSKKSYYRQKTKERKTSKSSKSQMKASQVEKQESMLFEPLENDEVVFLEESDVAETVDNKDGTSIIAPTTLFGLASWFEPFKQTEEDENTADTVGESVEEKDATNGNKAVTTKEKSADADAANAVDALMMPKDESNAIKEDQVVDKHSFGRITPLDEASVANSHVSSRSSFGIGSGKKKSSNKIRKNEKKLAQNEKLIEQLREEVRLAKLQKQQQMEIEQLRGELNLVKGGSPPKETRKEVNPAKDECSVRSLKENELFCDKSTNTVGGHKFTTKGGNKRDEKPFFSLNRHFSKLILQQEQEKSPEIPHMISFESQPESIHSNPAPLGLALSSPAPRQRKPPKQPHRPLTKSSQSVGCGMPPQKSSLQPKKRKGLNLSLSSVKPGRVRRGSRRQPLNRHHRRNPSHPNDDLSSCPSNPGHFPPSNSRHHPNQQSRPLQTPKVEKSEEDPPFWFLPTPECCFGMEIP